MLKKSAEKSAEVLAPDPPGYFLAREGSVASTKAFVCKVLCWLWALPTSHKAQLSGFWRFHYSSFHWIAANFFILTQGHLPAPHTQRQQGKRCSGLWNLSKAELVLELWAISVHHRPPIWLWTAAANCIIYQIGTRWQYYLMAELLGIGAGLLITHILCCQGLLSGSRDEIISIPCCW